MHLKKFLLFGLMAAILPAVAEEAADRKTATSLKYVTHELDTRQNKFTAEANKAMEYTNSAGTVQKRAVTSELGTSTSDTSLPMVGGVNTKLNQKQDDIDPVNDHTAVTYTGTAGQIGQKGIYQATGTYAEQSDNLIDAKTFNAALKNGLDSEFKCSDNKQPGTDLCWLWEIHNGMQEPYVSATGTVTQDGTPTPTNPIDPVFNRQGNMVLRKVGNYADSYDATTHKITRRVGVKVLDGTESWYVLSGDYPYFRTNVNDIHTVSAQSKCICTHFLNKSTAVVSNDQGISVWSIGQESWIGLRYDAITPASAQNAPVLKSYIAEQYAAGTPVTVYYPLATPVEEDWTENTYSSDVYIPQGQQ